MDETQDHHIDHIVCDCPDCMPEEDHREDRDREYDWMEGMEPDTKEDIGWDDVLKDCRDLYEVSKLQEQSHTKED